MLYREIEEIVKETGIQIIECDAHLDGKGFYLPNANVFGSKGALFVQSDLSKLEKEKIILHELGHLLSGSTLTRYSAPQLHLANETKVNELMTEEKIAEWLRGFDGQYSCVEPENFLNWCNLSFSYYPVAERKIKDLLSVSKESYF